ncbi:MAG TPA: cupin domain-containing protein [Acidimicrobiales bacterium]|jgi:mannose-6-phosphate isomerase-like protein (cupin superfamily)|nr:cupin domain-containing protein [Acidimicrobiales bacterium]
MTLSTYFSQDADHQRIRWIGDSTVEILLDSATSDGQLMILRTDATAGDAAPVHVHGHEDEVFLVLEGSLTVWVGDARREVGPGGICFLPRGVPHAYRVTSATAKVLNICTPGGLEAAFREAGWNLRDPAPEGWAVTPTAVAEAMGRVSCQILGPPRGADDGPIQVVAAPAAG